MHAEVELLFTCYVRVPGPLNVIGTVEGLVFIEGLAAVLVEHGLMPVAAGGDHDISNDRLTSIRFCFLSVEDARDCSEAMDGAIAELMKGAK